MSKRCISIRSCSHTRPGICSQTKPKIFHCFLSGQSLQGRGQFLVLLKPEQDQEHLSAITVDYRCQTGLTPWSVSFPFHRANLLFLLFCKTMFPGSVGALLVTDVQDSIPCFRNGQHLQSVRMGMKQVGLGLHMMEYADICGSMLKLAWMRGIRLE